MAAESPYFVELPSELDDEEAPDSEIKKGFNEESLLFVISVCKHASILFVRFQISFSTFPVSCVVPFSITNNHVHIPDLFWIFVQSPGLKLVHACKRLGSSARWETITMLSSQVTKMMLTLRPPMAIIIIVTLVVVV